MFGNLHCGNNINKKRKVIANATLTLGCILLGDNLFVVLQQVFGQVHKTFATGKKGAYLVPLLLPVAVFDFQFGIAVPFLACHPVVDDASRFADFLGQGIAPPFLVLVLAKNG